MIRVALSMLTDDAPKYAGVLFGIGVTTFLTTLFSSMFAGMLTRTFALVDDTPWADVWVMDPACRTVTQTENIPQTSDDRVRSVAGVASTSRLALGTATARLPHGRFLPVDVVGVDDATLIGVPASVPSEVALRLRAPDAVLADHGGTRGQLVVPESAGDAWAYGAPRPEAPARDVREGDELHVNNAAVRVRGVIAGSPRFNPQPVLYTTFANAARILPPLRHRLTFVLVSVQAGHDPADVARQIESATGLRARTRAEFKRDTVMWFLANAEFVSHVGIMTFFAFVVGLAISGLMLFMFTRENARLYATLKAIGASNARLASMVIAQAGLAGLLGFGLGIGACGLIGSALATTGFPFRVMPITLVLVGGLALAVAVLSGVGSLRAVMRLEPAIVFK